MILLYHNKCDFCGTCVGVCPENCIDLTESELMIDHETCTLCHKCVWICPVEALYTEKKNES
jgi:NAD-dependent dihydropyrimidine dehydrogenase PreA subunit